LLIDFYLTTTFLGNL